jgi:hypothetical protein
MAHACQLSDLGKKLDSISKISSGLKDVTQVVEHLLSMCSNSSSVKKNQTKLNQTKHQKLRVHTKSKALCSSFNTDVVVNLTRR